MKKILCFLLAGVLLLGGCSIVREDTNQTTAYQITEKQQEVALEPSIVINPVLYFVDKSKAELLAAETRSISVEQGERAERRIIEELINGPQGEDLQPIAEGFTYDGIEILPDLVNVYLSTTEEKDEVQIAKVKIAIAATIADYSGVDYVNVFVNGVQQGLEGVPVGVLQKTKNGLAEEINKYRSNARSETPTMNVALYFLDNTEQYLVPEERSIMFKENTPEEMLESVVAALMRGPENTYQHIPVIDKSLMELLGASIEQTEDGRRIARLDFSKPPVALTEQFKDGEDLAAKALAKTITGFMPDLDGVEIYVGGEPRQAEQKVYTEQDADSLLGNSIQLYFPNSAYSKLTGVERMVSQSAAGYPRELLAELMKGPVVTDKKEISPAFLSGISMDDVNTVYLAGDIAVVDFKSSVSEKIKGINRDEEVMMIYSIVNTMTNIEGIKRVQFLLDGERVESLGGGSINVLDPLLRNPGIIVSNE